MPVFGDPVRRGALSAALLALSILAEPAAAERVQARLTVEAIVLPSCRVTTATTSSAAICTIGERPLVTMNPAAGVQPVVRVAGPEASTSREVKVVTLTY